MLVVLFTLAAAGVAPAQAGPVARQRGEGGAPLVELGPGRAAQASTSHQLRTRWTDQVSRTHPLPQYPRPQLTRRRWLNLNGVWQFEGAGPNSAPPSGRDLPGRILVPFAPESMLSGVQRHHNQMWYRRLFKVPRSWLGRRACGGAGCHISLHFGAVDYRAVVFVNGKRLAAHVGGYDGFAVDVTRALRSSGPQELLVGVTDKVETSSEDQVVGKQRLRRSGAIWYTPSSGIWRTVWIEPVSAAHVHRLVMTPDLQRSLLQLTALTTGSGKQRVRATAYDGRTPIGTVSGPANKQLSLPVPDPKLWSPSHPFLYRLELSLDASGHGVDQVGSYFGMRSISVGVVDGKPRLLLNGRFVFQLGALDQGYWPDGLYTAPTDQALRYDLSQEKALGFNTVRDHMKVEPDRWYYWADRLGLLVWQDMPALARKPSSVASKTQFKSELHNVIVGLAPHPSIVMWVLFNEGWGEFDPAGITAQVKQWDPSRLVDTDSGQNCCSSLPDAGSGDVYDNHSYPAPQARAPFDSRAVVDGEFGGLGLFVAGHTWASKGWAYEREQNGTQLTDRFVQLLADVRELEPACALSGAIYTQPYDVEREIDGLDTYDRMVLKVDETRVRAANAAVLAAATSAPSGSCPSSGSSTP